MHHLHTIAAYGIFAGAGVFAATGIGATLYDYLATRRSIKRRLREMQKRAAS
jgi:hypothetical protein